VNQVRRVEWKGTSLLSSLSGSIRENSKAFHSFDPAIEGFGLGGIGSTWIGPVPVEGGFGGSFGCGGYFGLFCSILGFFCFIVSSSELEFLSHFTPGTTGKLADGGSAPLFTPRLSRRSARETARDLFGERLRCVLPPYSLPKYLLSSSLASPRVFF
jgi:hypothetical protein